MRVASIDRSAAMCKRAAENATAAGVALDVIHGDMLDFVLRTSSTWPSA